MLACRSLHGSAVLGRSRAMVPVLAALLCAVAVSASHAATTVRVVNPRDGNIINLVVSPPVYLVNGTCHMADAVGISIDGGAESPATVQGAAWEWLWDLSGFAPDESVDVTVTPYLGGVAGVPQTVTVKVRAQYPGGALGILTSSVIAGVYAGAGSTYSDPTQPLRFAVGVRAQASPSESIDRIRLASATSEEQISIPAGLAGINVDSMGYTTIPASFLLGNKIAGPGLLEAIATVQLTLRQTGGEAPNWGWSNTFSRSVIVDARAPQRKAGVSVTYPRKNVFKLAGRYNDAMAGIASVLVEITPPGGADPVVLPARLTYGANYNSDVNWELEYETAVEGLHAIVVRVADNAGNVARDPSTGTFDVMTDRTDPVVTVTSPAPMAYVSGAAVLVSGTITDASPTTWVLSDSGVPGPSGPGPAINYVWDTTLVPDGLHVGKVEATDQQHNVGAAATAFTVDNTLPVVAFSKPANGDFVSGIVQITGAVDECNLDAWKVQADTGSGLVDIPGATGTTANVSALWDTNAIPASTVCTLKIVATDLAGNTNAATADTITVTVVKKGSVTITAPPDGAFVKGLVKIKGTIAVDALDHWELHDLNSTPTKLTEGATLTFEFDWDTTGKDGQHIIRLMAEDIPGTTVDTSIVVFVDNTAPVVTLTSPAASAFVRGTTSINASVDDVHPDTWEIRIDGATLVPPGVRAGSTAAFAWNTATVPDGLHAIKVLATDKAGNDNAAVADGLTVTVDNTPPVVSITAPADGAFIKGNSNLTGTVTDATSPVSWQWYDNGRPIPGGSGTGVAAAVTWQTPGGPGFPVGDGAHTIKLVGTDKAGNTTDSVDVAVIVDNTPPTLTVDALPKVQDGADFFVQGIIRVVGTIIEANLLDWKLTDDNDAAFSKSGTQSGHLSEPYTTLGDGPHTFRLKATDQVGQQDEKTVTVIADNTAPVVVLNAPTPSMTVGSKVYVKGNVTVTGTVTDSYLKVWKLSLGGSQVASGTTSAVSYAWNTTANVGSVDVVLAGSDRIGHLTSATRTVVVDNTGPGVKITSPIAGQTLPPSVAMGSILTLIFRVDHSAIEPSGARAPLAKLDGGQLNAPAVTVNVTGPSGVFALSLKDALTKPNLVDSRNGSATVSGSADDGYMVIWQLPILRTHYAYGKEYTIAIGDATDVLGNTGTGDQIKFRVSLTR